jgi:WD40 repeat protein
MCHLLRYTLFPLEIFIRVEYFNMSCFMLQEFDGALDCISLAVTCAFNKRGTLLAVGCNDGRIVIWDFLTRGIAKIISAHVHPVCSLRLV